MRSSRPASGKLPWLPRERRGIKVQLRDGGVTDLRGLAGFVTWGKSIKSMEEGGGALWVQRFWNKSQHLFLQGDQRSQVFLFRCHYLQHILAQIKKNCDATQKIEQTLNIIVKQHWIRKTQPAEADKRTIYLFYHLTCKYCTHPHWQRQERSLFCKENWCLVSGRWVWD